MKTKKNVGIQSILGLLVFVALTAALAGCGGSTTNNNVAAPVNRATPDTTVSQTPTPNPAETLLGTWETRDPRFVGPYNTASGASSDFVRLKFNYAKEDKSIFTGDVTDVSSNKNIGTYTLYPNKSVKLDFPAVSGLSNTHDYELASDGNTLSLKTDSSPIIFKKGTANTDVEKDARTLSDAGVQWDATPSTKASIDSRLKYTVDFVTFDSPTASGEGWGGRMDLNQTGMGTPVKTGTYIIAANKKIIIDVGSGRTEGVYSIETNGDLLRIKFADGTEWVFNKK